MASPGRRRSKGNRNDGLHQLRGPLADRTPAAHRAFARPSTGTRMQSMDADRGLRTVCIGGRIMRPLRSMPADFTAKLAVLGSRECAEYYRCSLTAVTRWRSESGILPHKRAMPFSHPQRRAILCVETGMVFASQGHAARWPNNVCYVGAAASTIPPAIGADGRASGCSWQHVDVSPAREAV